MIRENSRSHFGESSGTTSRPVETADEKKLRLRKDWISFLVKEVLVYLSALAIIIGIIVYSFVVLAHPGWPREDRQFATSLLGMAASAVFGIAFGRSLKS